MDPAKEFGGNSGEKKLDDKMKVEFGLVKKSCKYFIHSIQDQVVKFTAQILTGETMRKCHADEVLTLVVSLTTQCMNRVQYN